MTRSQALTQSLWLLRRYGENSLRRTEFPFVFLGSQYTAQSCVDLDTRSPGAVANRRPSPSSPLGGYFFHRGRVFFDYPCTIPFFSRHISYNTFRVISGFRTFSAQPLPAKKSEDQNKEPGHEFPTGGSSETGRMVSASAIDVDKALEDYDKVLDQHRKYYASKYDSTLHVLWSYLRTALKIFPMTWRLTISLPGMLWRATFSPWSAKKDWLVHQWKHVKDGTKHYWVTIEYCLIDEPASTVVRWGRSFLPWIFEWLLVLFSRF